MTPAHKGGTLQQSFVNDGCMLFTSYRSELCQLYVTYYSLLLLHLLIVFVYSDHRYEQHTSIICLEKVSETRIVIIYIKQPTIEN